MEYGRGIQADVLANREDGVQIIEQWVPHRYVALLCIFCLSLLFYTDVLLTRHNSFWPHPDATDDSVIYVWAHPSATDSPMDHLFFLNLLMYISDVSEGKRKMDLIQIMLAQYVHSTLFPFLSWPVTLPMPSLPTFHVLY
jgi:hypothetical protein